MTLPHVFSDDKSIYAVRRDGALLWFRDELRNGTNGANAERGWAAGSGNQVGRGWSDLDHVIGAEGGVNYVIKSSGELLWFRDDLRNGTNGANAERGWAAGSGNQIGVGWSGLRHVMYGGNGVIYAIRATGELLWFRDELRNGTNGANAARGWAAGSGNQIGVGWGEAERVFSGGGGVIYAIDPSGGLLWFRDDFRNGTNGPNAERGWAAGSGNQIGVGWSD